MLRLKFHDHGWLVQVVPAAIVLAAVTLAPPARGFMVIVPILVTARPAVAASRSDGLIVAAGALPGSIIVVGDRARILPAALADGSIVLAAGRSGCLGARGAVT